MQKFSPKALRNKTTFITGFAKNAGKTTFLNYALNVLRKETPCALLSIGLDGENTDAVFNNPKPQIKVCEGDVFVTACGLVRGTSFEILKVFPFNTVLGKITLYKAKRQEYVELSGPQSNTNLSEIINYINSQPNLPKTILIDGAINRLTQISAGINAQFVYVVCVNNNNFNDSVNKIKLLFEFQNPKHYKTPENNALIINGAFTQTKFDSLGKECQNIVIDDLTKVFLTFNQWQLLNKNHNVYFKNRLPLKFAVIITKAVNYNELTAGFDNSVKEKLLYNPYAIQ